MNEWVRKEKYIHPAHEFLLCFRAEVAVDGGLDLEEGLDHVFEAGCRLGGRLALWWMRAGK